MNEFIPVVPFDSYSEYEQLLACVIREYQAMVMDDVAKCRLLDWCRFWEGLGDGEKRRWLIEGMCLFLKLTKGLGKDWCMTMNTMVVHALDTAVRVMVKARKQVYYPMVGDDEDRLEVARLLERETALAICDERGCSMSEFKYRNFMCVWQIDDNDFWNISRVPIAQVQAMQLAFAMIAHPRLGCAGGGRKLGGDVIKLILANVFEPDMDDNDDGDV